MPPQATHLSGLPLLSGSVSRNRMSKNKLFSDISVSAVQAAVNQFSSVLIFFIISARIDKPALGNLNWMIAMLLIIFSLLGFGFEHITVRKIATGEAPRAVLQTYLLHVFLCGIFCAVLILLFQPVVPLLREQGRLFIWLAAAQFFSFVCTPFRQIINGMERYRLLFIMSSFANLIKVPALLVVSFAGDLSVEAIVKIYFLASLAELLLSLYIYLKFLRLPMPVIVDWKRYTASVKEALPVFGVIVLSTAIARMDWVLLGLMSTAAVVADYSVANRVFELATLPLLALAPVLFPKIVRSFEHTRDMHRAPANGQLKILIRIEIIIAVFIVMVANLCWEDMINLFTDRKYGTSGKMIFLVMSFAMPLLYLTNIFWSVLFARKRMRAIFFVFLLTFTVNIIADCIAIPLFGPVGAAAGYVLALLVQAIVYFRITDIDNAVKRQVFLLLPVALIACGAGWLAVYLADLLALRMMIACAGYILLLIITGILTPEHWRATRTLISSS